MILNWKYLLENIRSMRETLKQFFDTAWRGDMITAKVAKDSFVCIMYKCYYAEEEHYIEEVRVLHLQKYEVPKKILKMLNESEEGLEINITEIVENDITEIDIENFLPQSDRSSSRP